MYFLETSVDPSRNETKKLIFYFVLNFAVTIAKSSDCTRRGNGGQCRFVVSHRPRLEVMTVLYRFSVHLYQFVLIPLSGDHAANLNFLIESYTK